MAELKEESEKSDLNSTFTSDKKIIYEKVKKEGNIDEEDVPEDFFDDFSNQDFMAGLDVVDTWDDEDQENSLSRDVEKNNCKEDGQEAGKEEKENEDKDQNKKTDRKNKSDKGRRKSSSRSPPTRLGRYNERRSPRDRRDWMKFRSRYSRDRMLRSRHYLNRGSEDRLKRGRSRTREKEERKKQESSSELRRDPEKTRRDIQKDKDRRTKDEEAKIISEKLKVVETGLVPPGMEMDIDINMVKSVIAVAKEESRDKDKKSMKTSSLVKEENYQKERYLHRKGPSPYKKELPTSKSRSKSIDYRRLAFSPPLGYNAYAEKPKRLRSRSNSFRRSRSNSVRRSLHIRRSRCRSLEKSRSPFMRRKRRASPTTIYREERRRLRSPDRRRRGRSPESDLLGRGRWLSKSRDKSPSNVSDREKWLTSRELSPDSIRRQKVFLDDLHRQLKKDKHKDKKKKDFLKEVHKKLNETPKKPDMNIVQYPGFLGSTSGGPSPMPRGSVPCPIQGNSGSGSMTPNPGSIPQVFMSAPVPHQVQPGPGPCPMPINSPSSMHVPMHGPQNSMIVMGPGPGPGFMQGPLTIPGPFNPNFSSMPNPVPSPFGKPEDSQYNEQFFIGQSVGDPQPVVSRQFSPNVSNQKVLKNPQGDSKPTEVSISDLKSKETVKKLFDEKKISLADYLSLTAMDSAGDFTKPVNLQHKIKVICRCQEAIKALDSSFPLDGRFFLKKNFLKQPEKLQELKGQSPLRKIPVVRFQFTTPLKGNEEKNTYSRIIDRLLANLGLNVGNTRDSAPSPQSITNCSTPDSTVNAPTPPPMKTQTVKSSFTKVKPMRAQDFMLGTKFQMKMSQTDSFLMKCKICEIRSARTFVTVGVQCEQQETNDIGIQCSEEKSSQEMFKKQSLAHLTPAQILKQTSEKNDKKEAIFPGAQKLSFQSPASNTTTNSGGRNNNSFPINAKGKLDQARSRLANERFKPSWNKQSESSFDARFDKPRVRTFDNRPQPFIDDRPVFENTHPIDGPLFDRPSFNKRPFDNQFDRLKPFDRDELFDRPFERPRPFDRGQLFDEPHFERMELFDRPQEPTFEPPHPFDRQTQFERPLFERSHPLLDRERFDPRDHPNIPSYF